MNKRRAIQIMTRAAALCHKDQLRAEIETQKEIFYMQHPMLQEKGGAPNE